MRKQNRTDFIEQIFLPNLPRWLPRRLAFWFMKKLARRKLFTEGLDLVLQARVADPLLQAQLALNSKKEIEEFSYQQSLCRLLDMSDALRGASVLGDKNVDVFGAWPTVPGFVAISFHFGTGLIGLAHLSRSSGPCAFVSRPYAPEELNHRRYLARGVAERLDGIAAACAHPIIFTGGNFGVLKKLLDNGVSVCGLIDTPVLKEQRFVSAKLFGRDINLPSGLLRLASEASVPVVIFSVVPDLKTGRRTLRIGAPLRAANDIDFAVIAKKATEHLQECINALPAAWYFWPQFAQLLKK
jgi:hypothetical protein